MQVDALSMQSGAAFDARYVEAQVAAHRNALALLTSYTKSGQAPALQAHAPKATRSRAHRATEKPSEDASSEGNHEVHSRFGSAAITWLRRFEMAEAKTLQDLFHEQLKDIYYAENKIQGASKNG